jgi:hypothetical protein
MQSLLSQFQTPTAPRRISRFFPVWLLFRLPCGADHSAYFGLTSFISSILSAVDAHKSKELLHRCQCKSPRENEISVNGIVENAEILCVRDVWSRTIHQRQAMRRLGAKSISTLVVADSEVAWQILALNTEKAHNLKERSLEVIRIYRGLVDEDATRPESQFAFYLDEPALVTLGVCYERVPRFGGGAYHSILRRLETFTDESLRAALRDHEKRATMVLDVEEKVAIAVKKLKERGLVSPYLRSFVVARINPLRWIKGEPPPLEEVLKTMRERATKFNVEKIKPQDLAGAAGPPDEET